MDWREQAEFNLKRMPQDIKDLRDSCFNDLRVFARTMNPGYMYGETHMDIFKWMMEGINE